MNNAPALAAPNQPCLFLDRLPLEIRLEIYRYLCGRYIKRWVDVKSNNVGHYSRYIRHLGSPDYSYDLDTSILYTNWQIRNEALDLFEEEFTFITIHGWSGQSTGLEQYGVAVVTEGFRWGAFPMTGMSIVHNDGDELAIRDYSSWGGGEVSVFEIEDLPLACVYLQREGFWGKPRIRISISPRIADTATKETRPAAKSRLARCIDTVSRIRGALSVTIDGPISPDYKARTVSTMCKHVLTATEAINLVEAHYAWGDEARMKGDMEAAIAEYKEALCITQLSVFYEEFYEIVHGGRFDGRTVGFARLEAKVCLRTLIADCLLQLKQHRLARKYVERVYGHLHSNNLRLHRYQKFPLGLPNNSNPEVYAKFLLVAAKISLAFNNRGASFRELREAAKHDPSDQDIPNLLEQCSAHISEKNRRRRVTRGQQRASAERKFRAAFFVTIGRTTRADKAYHDDNFTLAREKYEAAYLKVQPLIDPTRVKEYYDLYQLLKDLHIDILAKLMITCVELNDYDAVHRWASTLDTHVPRFFREFNLDRKQVLYVVKAFYTAYYSKAVVYQKCGNPIEAIKNFKKALVCDPGCHATYYQLAALKESRACDETIALIDCTLHPFMETCGFFFSPDVA